MTHVCYRNGAKLDATAHLDQDDGSVDAHIQAGSRWGKALTPTLDATHALDCAITARSASFFIWAIGKTPPSKKATAAWRIALASMLAFWCGSFANSFVLAKMKIFTDGKWLWTRTIGSTAVGELVDSSLFYFIAFYGIWATDDIVKVAIIQYILKTSWEIIATPLTYAMVGFLKRQEREDYFDRSTNFSPFRLES